MNLDPELQHLLWCNLRTFLPNLVAQLICVAVLNSLMERRRSAAPLTWYVVLKGNFMIFVVACRQWLGTDWSVFFNGVLGLCGTIGGIYMMKYTYYGDFPKIMISNMIAEQAVEILLVPSFISVNYLEHRSQILAIQAEFQMADLLIPLIEGLFFIGIARILFPVLRKFRHYEIKHKKAVSIFSVAYIAFAQLPGLTNFHEGTLYIFSQYIMLLLFTSTALILCMRMVDHYQKKVQEQRRFLLLQQEYMETYHETLQKEMEQTQKNRRVIQERVQSAIRKRKEGKKLGNSPSQSTSYIKELKEEYSRITAGTFCTDWIIDSILSHETEAANAQGIQMDISMLGYARGMIPEEELARLLFVLLDFGVREKAEKISLHVGTVRNHMVINYSAADVDRENFPEQMIREQIRTWNGTLVVKEEEDGMRAVVTLQNITY